ncbi:hypothetical protein EC968_002604 [Mortierella alpina]|nr:hypothetical protein EC968_002604 [Mortierella alpina]
MGLFKASLSAKDALGLATKSLSGVALDTSNNVQVAELCTQAKSALSRIKRSERRTLVRSDIQQDRELCENIADNYEQQMKLWEGRLQNTKMSKRLSKKRAKWENAEPTEASPSAAKPNSSGFRRFFCGGTAGNQSRESLDPHPKHSVSTSKNVPGTKAENPPLPRTAAHFIDTPQLVRSLHVLKAQECPKIEECTEVMHKHYSRESEEGMWANTITPPEKKHFETLATQIVKEFHNDELLEDDTIAEVTCLASALGRDQYRSLVSSYVDKITSSTLLDLSLVQGLPRLIQSAADLDYLQADDLVKILRALSKCLQATLPQTPSPQQQSPSSMHTLVMAISRVLDTMTHTQVKGMDQDEMRRVSESLGKLRNSSDAYLVYQAAYALQALKNIPDDESPWKSIMRQGGEVLGSAVGLGIAAYTMDIPAFLEKLETLQASAEQIVEVVFLTYEAASTLIEGGQGLRNSFQTAFNYRGRQPWYQQLRLADLLIQQEEFAKFEQRARKSVLRTDPSFQWGLCQRLGEIAANSSLSYNDRERALNFLGEIFHNDGMWCKHPLIKQLIIAILLQLKQAPLEKGTLAVEIPATDADSVAGDRCDDNPPSDGNDNDEQRVKIKVGSLIKELGRKSKGLKRGLYLKCFDNTPYPFPLKSSEPSHKLQSLLQRVQKVPDIKKDLEILKKRRLEKREKSTIYIEPTVKASHFVPDDAKKTLMDTVLDFLKHDGRVLLLLGDSGAGKSTFSKELERRLWDQYKDDDWIPLHINLPTIDRPYQDLINKHLQRIDFSESQIREMKRGSKFILICDGYDESQQNRNLYESNELTNDPESMTQWTAKMVISCRSEYLGSKYQDLFQPPPLKMKNRSLAANQDTDRVDTPAATDASATTNTPEATDVAASDDFREVEIAPFTKDNIEKYVEEYVREKSSFDAVEWSFEEYMKALETVPNLLDLVKNPFLLTLSLKVLPRVVDLHRMQELSQTSITRVRLYDHFVDHWLERERKRVSGKELSPQARAAFDTLDYEGFTSNGLYFLKRLASAIYKEQAGQPVVEYLRFRDEKTWKAAFFKREDEMRILREACPLIRTGKQYRFIHRSLLEYCFTLAVFDPQECNALRPDLPKTLQRRSSEVSISSCDEDMKAEKEPTETQQINVRDHPLSWKNLTLEPSVLNFLAERAQEEPLFKKQLLELIKLSKTVPKAHRAAANAITILVRSGHRFNGADLSEISIRGADLSGGELRNADLSGANMKDATFGEYPYLVQRSGIQCCVYSPDGGVCALGLCTNEIKLYDTTAWKELHTLQGHEDMVSIVVYSPDGKQVASGSDDKTVRLWDPSAGSNITVFGGHTGRVECVVYSPKGDLIASCSSDKTVRLWNVKDKGPGLILFGHENIVMSVVFSPSGEHLASGSYDKTVRIWNTKGSCIYTRSHTSCVKSVVYSPDGKHIASASYDKTVKIWDSASGNLVHSLLHAAMLMSVAYSPNGLQIAAASECQVQLWDSKTGMKHHLLSGHTDTVTSVVYSPSGHQIASSSHDRTVRLWDTQSGAPGPTLNGHVNSIMSIVYAPKGHQVATASLDKTVRLWDSQTGASVQTSSGHTDRVNSVTYSPKGCILTSGGLDKTLQLWNAKTGVPVKTLIDHGNPTTSDSADTITKHPVGSIARVGYSPDGGHIAVGSIERVGYSPDGSQIAIGSDDRYVYIWNIETGKVIRRLEGHDDCVTSVAYSPDGRELASGSDDWAVFLWSAESDAPLHRLSGHTSAVTDVAYSPRGEQIASGSHDKSVILWHANNGELIRKLEGHKAEVTSVVYSPEGKWIASGSNDKTVRVWDAITGHFSSELTGHTDKIRSIIFSPDSQEIASGSLDRTVRLWNTTTGQRLITVKVFDSPIRSIAWVKNDLDKDGHDKDCHDKGCHDNNDRDNNDIESFLATGSDDKSVRVWSVRRIKSEPHVQLHWNSRHDRLVVSDAKFENTLGLSDINRKLMEQRGAKGTGSGIVEQQQHKKSQAIKLRKATEKVVSINTAVAQMKPEHQSTRPDVSSHVNGSLPSPPQEPMEFSKLPRHEAGETLYSP